MQTDGRKTENALNDELNNLRAKKSTCLQIIRDRTGQLNNLQKSSRDLEADMESISTIEIEVKSIDREISGLQQMITSIREEISQAGYDGKLRELGLQLRHLETEKEALSQEYSQLMRQGESRLKLDLARDKVQEMTKHITDQ